MLIPQWMITIAALEKGRTTMRLIDADALDVEQINTYYADSCRVEDVQEWLDDQPTIDAEPVRHGRWVETSKHEWEKDDDGSVDEFAFDWGYHNGPVCEICGFSFCEHCNPDSWDDNGCDKRYVCSECGRTEKNKEPYCNCGAKMDTKEENV